MMMRSVSVVVALLALAPGTSSGAQLAGLLGRAAGLPPFGEAGGAYLGGDRVRTYMSSDPVGSDGLTRTLVKKASDMAEARGFPRIGVTKAKCTTMFVSGSPRSTTCTLIAAMLHPGETAKPSGDHAVRYFEREDVRRGLIALAAD